jgi:hypothetical protein
LKLRASPGRPSPGLAFIRKLTLSFRTLSKSVRNVSSSWTSAWSGRTSTNSPGVSFRVGVGRLWAGVPTAKLLLSDTLSRNAKSVVARMLKTDK